MAILLPLLCALLYAASALVLKRVMQLGVPPMLVALLGNIATAILLLPLLFWAEAPSADARWYQPLLPGTLFLVGVACNILALIIGEVSVATPVLGSKVLLVALLSVLFLDQPVLPVHWLAAALASISFMLLRGPPVAPGAAPSRFGATIGLVLLAALCFAAADIFLTRWVPLWSPGLFLPLMFGLQGLISLPLLLLCRRARLPRKTWAGLGLGLGLAALNVLLFAIVLAVWREPIVANVLYSSRGIWSVLIIWTVGHWFSNREGTQGRRVLIMRLVGAVMMLIAIIAIVVPAVQAAINGLFY